MERENTEESTTKESAEKENNDFVQVSLSIFSGVLGGIAVDILNGTAPSPQERMFNLIYDVALVGVLGLIVWGIVVHHNNPKRDLWKPISIGLIPIVLVMFLVCFVCFKKMI